jgi:hypothetical protein
MEKYRVIRKIEVTYSEKTDDKKELETLVYNELAFNTKGVITISLKDGRTKLLDFKF